MTTYLIFKYLHYLAIFGLAGTLLAELFLVKNRMKRSEIAVLARIDALYGLFAILVVAIGLTLWFGVGKGAEFYDNPVLHIKVGLVVVIGVISIWPTVYFIKQRKGNPDELVDLPAYIRRLILIEVLILLLVPYLAVMMAHGLRF